MSEHALPHNDADLEAYLHPEGSTHAHALTIQQALTAAQTLGLPRLDAQVLLLHALSREPHDRAWLLAHSDEVLTSVIQEAFASYVQRRLNTEPVAYITGHKEFFGLRLHVDARVLDPRADTETLVEWALSSLADVPAPTVVDLGTGSGAIALALKHARPDAQLSAVDASAVALAVAQANAQQLGLAMTFHHGSWLAPFGAPHAAPPVLFDAIVSNPPYVASDDAHLAALKHEPLSALASGHDGLDDIRLIVRQASQHLKPGGWLLLEHGFDQAHAVQTLLSNQGFQAVQSRPDIAGILRCTGGQWPTVK
ncbi:peptide chain release factor N(5)-glutamine methyltransferase [Limnohabitans sp. TS-CS-82]|uniref:peptide chain release factor N(5)-glutamine methyltransferase n=1 Tax=Limnohabitans sp. TS-CS-82 TaxID=2094193 RepID=UPI000CF2211F|nr:peptide chain release factor N(5)-glutamine methyltransferase [Limnohabitans sp. TS-CS-82]PQA82052.1 peptide chain release factor N(5)-glutamine methyltransferase [Limnohabitans sp. TS-CS-82]